MMRRKLIVTLFTIVLILGSAIFVRGSGIEYSVEGSKEEAENLGDFDGSNSVESKSVKVASHISTPEPLKAIYMTSWVAGTPSLREGIIDFIEDTELNAVVIDIKDDTGRISYEVADPNLNEIGSWENRISDLRDLLTRLHRSDIYVIGRVSVFQDPYFTSIRPDLAVVRASDGSVWKDYKGLSFIDVGAEEYWEYIVAIAEDAYAAGFDEINFDYIRFPSDGNMKDIAYTLSGDKQKPDALEDFFSFLYENLKDSGAVLSADLFGMTTTNKDDLNIGQVLERALPYFSYVAPMVYPSHYPEGFNGWANPAAMPYEIVKFSMDAAVERTKAMADSVNSNSTSTDVVALGVLSRKGHGNISPKQLRPWLQDFDLGATYTADMVREQIQATYDAGLTSWTLWDAANTYTKSALESYN